MATAGKDFLTLNDYWQTRSYTLRLKCKDGTASPEIESGPTNRPTYYLGSKTEILLDTLDRIPRIAASDLSVIRGNVSLRALPTKVRDVSGTVHHLKPCPAVRGSVFSSKFGYTETTAPTWVGKRHSHNSIYGYSGR